MPTTSTREIDLLLPGSYGKEVLVNDGLENLALGISGCITIALAASDVTLTDTPTGQAKHFVLNLTGTLTANVNVLVPATSRVYIASNNTTGAFTVTLRTAAGGGVAVDQATSSLLYCDGTNVYAVASGSGGGGGSGAPTDATYLVQTPHSGLTGERALQNTASIGWDFATAGQAAASVLADAITFALMQNITTARLLGRYTAGSGDVQEITLGSGLSLDASGVLTATVSGAQPLDATLTALAALVTAADQMLYFTGVDAAAMTALTAFARTLLDDASQAAMQTTLGLVPGTQVQPFDATLSALAGVTTAADRLSFFTGVDTASTTLLTPFARSLLDDTTAAQARATLEIPESGTLTSFLDLTDTDPTTYVGQAGKAVLVNPGETGLTFGTGSSGLDAEGVQDVVGAMTIDSSTVDFTYDDTGNTLSAAVKDASVTEAKLTLSDVSTANVSTVQHGLVPKAPGVATQYLDGLGAWSTPAGGGGSSTFLGLSDTPDVYAGQAGKGVTVNGAATALEFSTAVTGSYDLGVTWSGPLPASQVLLRCPFPRAVTFPAGLSDSQGRAGVAATALTTLDLRKNGTSVGSVQFAAAGTTATFTMASPTSFAVGDVLTVHAPGTPDATLADLGLSLAGTRTVAAGEMGATTYLGLLDTPDSYVGQGGKVVSVNGAATALEFTTPLAVGGSTTQAQYNNAGVLAGSSGLTLSATQVLSIAYADQAAGRTALGLGTLAVQNADAVAITGGSATMGQLALTAINPFDASSTAGQYSATRLTLQRAAGDTGVSAMLDSNGATSGVLSLFGNGTTTANRLLRLYDCVAIGVANADNSALKIGSNKNVQTGLHYQAVSSDTGAFGALTFSNVAGTVVGTVSTTATTTAYNTSSDIRLKHALQPLTGALSTLKALRPLRFLWNQDGSPGVGFLAHELQAVIPEAVTGLPDELNPDGTIKPQGVDLSKLIPHVTAALQEVLTRLETLEQALA